MSPPALPKDHLSSCLLLLLREEATHGYELLQRSQALGFDGGDPGRLYRSLRRLERDGFVRSAWADSESGPQRRIYEITRAGMEELHRRAQALAGARELVESFIGRYEEFVSLTGSRRRPRVRRAPAPARPR